MSTVLDGLPDLDADAGSGIVARRAVIRWGWRLFRREWRQQLLVLGLLTVAVAATIWGASVVTNSQIPPGYPTFGTGAAQVTLPGTDPRLAADIATIAARWGPADLIEKQNITTGTRQSVQVRAESPHGHYNSPLLGLVSGTYPAGPGQVALTSQVATQYGAHVGGTWRAAGTTWQVTGIVQDPSNLADQFALVAPGQLRHPSQAIMLLGPAAAQEIGGDITVPGVPAATVSLPTQQDSGVSQAVFILVVEVLGLAFIGLVSVASFSVMAQRRLRALGMLGAIGATERNLRLVMIAGGLAVGATAALAGAVLGLAAWFAYAPTVQRDTGHAVDAAHLPWWAFAIGIVLAIATSALASRRPAKTMAAVPVVAALSGRPAPPKAVRRSALPGVIVFAAGLACLASAGGLNGVAGQDGNGGGNGHALFLLAGLVITITGVCLLAPLAISVLAAGAGSRLPVAIRIALRDLVRYRARSGAALAATTFAVFLAMGICVVASIRFDNPLNWIGPDLSSNQVFVPSELSSGPGQMTQPSAAQLAALTTRVHTLAASLHATRGAAGIDERPVPDWPAGTRCAEFHRHRVRGHPAVAGHVRHQGQPDRSRHRHPHHAARAGGPAAPGDDRLEQRLHQRRCHPPARSRQRRRSALHAEQPLPGQPRDPDDQQPAQRHVRAEYGGHRVRGEQVPHADPAARVAPPGPLPRSPPRNYAPYANSGTPTRCRS